MTKVEIYETMKGLIPYCAVVTACQLNTYTVHNGQPERVIANFRRASGGCTRSWLQLLPSVVCGACKIWRSSGALDPWTQRPYA